MQLQKEKEFKQWVNDYSDLLYGFSKKHGFDSDTAKDIVQETFLAAWRNVEKYRGEASIKNWLFVILKNKINDHYRKAANIVAIESIEQDHNKQDYFDATDHWDKNAYPKKWGVNFDNKVEAKEFYTVFKNCAGKLKEIQNIVFVMKYVDGLESEDICKLLNLSPSNYWVIIHRAKVQLRACLQKNWMDK